MGKYLPVCFFFICQLFYNVGYSQNRFDYKDSLKGFSDTALTNNLLKQTGNGLLQTGKRTLVSNIKNEGTINAIVSRVKLFEQSSLFELNKLQVAFDGNYLFDTSTQITNALESKRWRSAYSLDFAVSLFSIPFDFSAKGANGVYVIGNTPDYLFNKANFNHQKYLEQLQEQVIKRISPDAIVATITKQIDAIRAGYERQLLDEITQIRGSFEKQFNMGLNLPATISNISLSDVASYRNQLFQSASAFNQVELQQQLQELKATVIVDSDSLILKNTLKELKRGEALEKIYERYISYKQRFDENKIVQELRSHLPFTKDNFKSFLGNRSNLKQVIRNHASLNSLQKLFLNLTHLDIGQNAVENGAFTFKDLMNAGVNTGFEMPKAKLGLVFGKSANTNAWLQEGLSSFKTNEYSNLAGFNISSPNGGHFSHTLSFNLFNFQTSSAQQEREVLNQTFHLSMPQHKDAVLTWQSQFPITNTSLLKVDLSKSFGSFTNSGVVAGEGAKSNPVGGLFSNNGQSNMAVAANWSGTILKSTVQFDLKHVGLGYSNPGNVSLRRGASELGLNFNRKLIQNKLTLRMSSNYRNQHFDPQKSFTYITFSNRLQASYRFKRNNRIGMLYQQSNYTSTLSGKGKDFGKTTRIEVNSVYSFYIGGKKVQNSSLLSNQNMFLPMLNGDGYESKNLTFMQNSSMLVGKNLLVLSVHVNQSDNKDYLFNTSFLNSEVHYNYNLTKGVQLINGVGYYMNAGWNKQIGIRQQLATIIAKKIDFNIEVSYKRAVQVIRKELANQVFVSSSIFYHL